MTNNQERGAADIIAASEDVIAPEKTRSSVENIVSVSNCVSPKGAYTTHIHNTTDGYMYFRQEFSYRSIPFEAILINDTTGYSTGDSVRVLPKEAVFTIRGHAFHALLLELPKRFHGFSQPDTVLKGEKPCYRVKASDELNNNASLFFDRANGRLSVLEILNPGNKTETITIEFSDWKNAGSFLLPHHIDIDQGGKIYGFDFSAIQVNDPAFQKKKIDTR